MPGAIRGHSSREQRPQHGACGPARERVPGGPGAGQRPGGAGAGAWLLAGRRSSFWVGRQSAG
eukprot:15051235-Alexandrium_andersonii.AAC.1